MKDPDPSDTGGAVASPADEQPAQNTPDGDSEEASTGPTHQAGTPRAENPP
jgi:hypothetical protein